LERFPVRSFGKGGRLLMAFLAMLVIPQLDGRLATWLSPSLAPLDPDNVFVWLTLHHVSQFFLTLGVMWLWSGDSLRNWGFNLGEARVSLRCVGWFALFCTLGALAIEILPRLFSHRPPNLGFPINAPNVAAKLVFHYLLSGSGEEPLFRGLIMVILLKSWTGEVKLGKVRMPVAGLWATLLFMLAHVNYTLVPLRITHFSLFQQMLALGYGLFYAALFYRTGSLLGPILAHGLSNGIPFTLVYLSAILTQPQPITPQGTGGAALLSSPTAVQEMVVSECHRPSLRMARMDTAVLAAYGFSAKQDLLSQLFSLNLEVAARMDGAKRSLRRTCQGIIPKSGNC
jgi:membrane protease YdiL (CAAX protease family)